VSALRFLYKYTLNCGWDFEKIRFARREKKLPVVLSPEEVALFLQAVKNKKHKTLLMTIYASGIRVLEATRLRIADIDSKRMTIRIRQGKGKKDHPFTGKRHQSADYTGASRTQEPEGYNRLYPYRPPESKRHGQSI
jgi:site-specific recombinase XerD